MRGLRSSYATTATNSDRISKVMHRKRGITSSEAAVDNHIENRNSMSVENKPIDYGGMSYDMSSNVEIGFLIK